jgi:hypothetical protein
MLALVRQQFGVGQPAGVVDGDVQVLPAGVAVLLRPVRSPVMR